MKLTTFRCDECGDEVSLLSPQRYPEGWRRKTVTATEVWDLCPICVEQDGIAPKLASMAVINRQVVAALLQRLPSATDQGIAEEAARHGVQMAGETVRRHRVAMGVPDSRKRKRMRSGGLTVPNLGT